jgi:hypothetical protein
MATLTIKPTAAGNDVQIKSGDGNTTHATFGDTSTVNMSAGTIASGVTFPAGHVLQCLSATKTDIFSSASVNNTWTAIPSLLIAITPSATSSKILVQYNVNTGMATGSHSGVATGIYRDGTIISGAKGSTLLSSQEATTTVATHYNTGDSNVGIDVHSMSFLDSPTIPSTPIAITYQVYLFNASGGAFVSYVNRTMSDGNAIYVTRGASTITVMEVAV